MFLCPVKDFSLIEKKPQNLKHCLIWTFFYGQWKHGTGNTRTAVVMKAVLVQLVERLLPMPKFHKNNSLCRLRGNENLENIIARLLSSVFSLLAVKIIQRCKYYSKIDPARVLCGSLCPLPENFMKQCFFTPTDNSSMRLHYSSVCASLILLYSSIFEGVVRVKTQKGEKSLSASIILFIGNGVWGNRDVLCHLMGPEMVPRLLCTPASTTHSDRLLHLEQ